MKQRRRSGWGSAIRLLILSATAGLAATAGTAVGDDDGRTAVVMLFDGFAPRYLELFPTPAFDRLRREGAWTQRMDPAFPTISLINGVTISTGCWPEHHGIVTNVFLDPERGLYDHASDSDWLIGCEHMHQAAERQGVRTAALGWVGHHSAKRGAQASTVPPGEEGFEDFPDDPGRGDQLVAQIARPPQERPRLILAYFKGPDAAGHLDGMEADTTRAAVVEADSIVARVLDRIDAQPDADRIQLIVTTDHGMVPVERVVNIARILRRHDLPARAVSTGTTSFLYFDDPKAVDSAVEKLSGYTEFDVVRRDAQPPHWHLGTGPRVGDLVISAHPPYFIEDVSVWPWYLRWLGIVGPDFLDARGAIKATHGYPTGTPGVEGIFYARGSAFAVGREVERVRAIDIHPTVMHVLGLEPGHPVDGAIAVRLLR